MRITYLGGDDEIDNTEARSVTWGGVTFKAGEAVEVDEDHFDPRIIEKVKSNRFFKVELARGEGQPKPVSPGIQPKPAEAAKTPPPKEPPKDLVFDNPPKKA